MFITQTFLLGTHSVLMLLLTQPSEMQGEGLNGAFSEGPQGSGAGGSVLLPRTAQWDLPKHLSVLSTLLWVCQAVKPLHGTTPLHKSGGRGDWRGRVRKTLPKSRDLVKIYEVSEKEHEQTRNTIKNRMSGGKAIKAY